MYSFIAEFSWYAGATIPDLRWEKLDVKLGTIEDRTQGAFGRVDGELSNQRKFTLTGRDEADTKD